MRCLRAISVLVLCTWSFLTSGLTLYGQQPLGQTSTGAWATTTLRAAYNTSRLQVPLPPIEFTRDFTIQLTRSAYAVEGDISIPHVGPSFWGFSIEMSVISQVLGKNSTHLNVPFLNLLENLVERAGGVNIRLGGNTQEYAALVDSDHPSLRGQSYGKERLGVQTTTSTPAVVYTMEMFYSAANISKLLDNKVKWYMGIPFNDTANWRLEIAEHGQAILGDNLLGLQAGNEPDFFEEFKRRPPGYRPAHYTRETGDLIQAIEGNDRIPNKRMLIGPSTSGQRWNASMVFDEGWLDMFHEYLHAVTVEHYVHDNCIAMYAENKTNARVPQQLLGWFLSHDNLVNYLVDYRGDAQKALAVNKPLIMFETNTGSCGGFPGISNSYTSAIWGADYGFQMAFTNFTHGMLHVGGQNVFYNPFTSPRTELAAFNQWTLGPIFYSTIVLAEALGKSDTARVVDLFPNSRDPKTPAYAIYERDTFTKVALFNYVSDPTGAADLSVGLTIDGGVPSSVYVKYLLASSVTEKDDITWAGQTFGNQYEVDGRLRGELNITEINCDVGENICRVPLPAPAVALVFFEDDDAIRVAQASATHPTTAYHKPFNTAKPAETALLATSNGHKNNANNPNPARTNFEYEKLKGAAVVGRWEKRDALLVSLLAVATAVLHML